jgi:hypothetical protein
MSLQSSSASQSQSQLPPFSLTQNLRPRSPLSAFAAVAADKAELLRSTTTTTFTTRTMGNLLHTAVSDFNASNDPRRHNVYRNSTEALLAFLDIHLMREEAEAMHHRRVFSALKASALPTIAESASLAGSKRKSGGAGAGAADSDPVSDEEIVLNPQPLPKRPRGRPSKLVSFGGGEGV